MASASDHRAHAALQPADCLILLPQRLPAAVETSIGPAHYPAACTQSDAFLQPSLRARKGRANSNSFLLAVFYTALRHSKSGELAGALGSFIGGIVGASGAVWPDLDSRTGFRDREWQKCWRLIKPGRKGG